MTAQRQENQMRTCQIVRRVDYCDETHSLHLERFLMMMRYNQHRFAALLMDSVLLRGN